MSCVDDIEDLASTVGDTPTKRAPRKRVIPKKFSTQLKHEAPVAESVIPGTQSVGERDISFSLFSCLKIRRCHAKNLYYLVVKFSKFDCALCNRNCSMTS